MAYSPGVGHGHGVGHAKWATYYHPHGHFPKGLEKKLCLPYGWAKRFGGEHPAGQPHHNFAQNVAAGVRHERDAREEALSLTKELERHADYQTIPFTSLQKLFELHKGAHIPVSKARALDYLKPLLAAQDEPQVKAQFWEQLMPLINPDAFADKNLSRASIDHLTKLFNFANHLYNLATA